MLTLITGGQKSGKSVFAESLTLGRCASPVYVATARIWDDEFRQRVEAHRRRRGKEWTNVEEPLKVGEIKIPEGSTVLLDCLTLLATNWMFECGEDIATASEMLNAQLKSLFSRNADFIVVTNEIGLGGVSSNPLQRKFADLQGSVNQMVASMADEVYFVISGIPVKIK